MAGRAASVAAHMVLWTSPNRPHWTVQKQGWASMGLHHGHVNSPHLKKCTADARPSVAQMQPMGQMAKPQ
jgi:quinol monooxygenase YgiN